MAHPTYHTEILHGASAPFLHVLRSKRAAWTAARESILTAIDVASARVDIALATCMVVDSVATLDHAIRTLALARAALATALDVSRASYDATHVVWAGLRQGYRRYRALCAERELALRAMANDATIAQRRGYGLTLAPYMVRGSPRPWLGHGPGEGAPLSNPQPPKPLGIHAPAYGLAEGCPQALGGRELTPAWVAPRPKRTRRGKRGGRQVAALR